MDERTIHSKYADYKVLTSLISTASDFKIESNYVSNRFRIVHGLTFQSKLRRAKLCSYRFSVA